MNQEITCPWCCRITNIIWVHGHGQCAFCGINIDECCRGETCSNENPSIKLKENKEINNDKFRN